MNATPKSFREYAKIGVVIGANNWPSEHEQMAALYADEGTEEYKIVLAFAEAEFNRLLDSKAEEQKLMDLLNQA